MGEQSWIVGTTKVVLWLQLDFSLSKAADSTATGAGVLVPPLPQASRIINSGDVGDDRAALPSAGSHRQRECHGEAAAVDDAAGAPG